jgi:hypothetical protein
MSLSQRRLAEDIARLPEGGKLFATLTLFERLDHEEAASQLGLSSAEAARLATRVHGHLADVLPIPAREVRASQAQAIAGLAARHGSHLNSKKQIATARRAAARRG